MNREGAPGPEGRVVSSESEQLILVDEADQPLGFISKAAAHDGAGRLHRAFSLFVFNAAGELLLQQRSREKRLWGGYWSNSCCSHPRAGEEMGSAVHRRLEQELGMGAELEFVYKFRYQAQFGELGAEHELCWVYLGRSSATPRPNANEIMAWRFVSPERLDAELAAEAARFTPWFQLEWAELRQRHGTLLERYGTPLLPATRGLRSGG